MPKAFEIIEILAAGLGAPPQVILPPARQPKPSGWEGAIEGLLARLAAPPRAEASAPRVPDPPRWESALEGILARCGAVQVPPAPVAAQETARRWPDRLEAILGRLIAPPPQPAAPALPPLPACSWPEVVDKIFEELQWWLLKIPVPPRTLRALRQGLAAERPEPEWPGRVAAILVRLKEPARIKPRATPRAPRPQQAEGKLIAAFATLERLRLEPRPHPEETPREEVASFASLRPWEQAVRRILWRLAAPPTVVRPPAPRTPAALRWPGATEKILGGGRPAVTSQVMSPALQPPPESNQPLTPEQLNERLRALRKDEGLYDATRRAAHVEPTRRWRKKLAARGLRPQPHADPERGWRWNERGARLRLISARTGAGWLHLGRWTIEVHTDLVVRKTETWWGGVSRRIVSETTTTKYYEVRPIRSSRREAHEARLERLERKYRLGGVTGLKKPRWLSEEEWRYRLEQSAEFAALLGHRAEEIDAG